MLHTLPGGSTPLIAALEDVAAMPGRLADPEVAAALILISDGGESCDGMDQAERVMRIENAVKTLYAANIKTFAVRFGEKGLDFADQDVIVDDGDLPTSKRLAYIGTNWTSIGAAQAKAMMAALPDGGKIAMTSIINANNMREGVKGFTDYIKANGGDKYQLVANEDDNGDASKAAEVTAALLAAHPDIKGVAGAHIMAPNNDAAVPEVIAGARSTIRRAQA